jgi:dihydroorotate dehydrogenase (NAD+) catalytic subunit
VSARFDPAVEVGGLRLKNPVLTASGTFGYGLEFARYGNLEDLGGMVLKGLSLEPREGNPMQRIAETPCGMLNAIGIQNIGAREFLDRKLGYLPWRETPVVANLYACSVAEFGELAALLGADERIAALEVNVSCPNVAEGGSAFGADTGLIREITAEVRAKAPDTPVWTKLSPNVTDIAACARAAEEGGAHAICLINTLLGMAVDLERRAPRLANVYGGLSGPAIKPVALRCVHQAARAVGIPIIGIGGIASARDALEFILVGAHAVQVGTASFMRPDMAFRIAAEIGPEAERLGVGSWEELRGSLST